MLFYDSMGKHEVDGFSFPRQQYESIQESVKWILPGGELNPGLPRDRRGYSPLYYRGGDVNETHYKAQHYVSFRLRWKQDFHVKVIIVVCYGNHFVLAYFHTQMPSSYALLWQYGQAWGRRVFIPQTAVWKHSGVSKMDTPRRGIEPRSPAWQAGILTTILFRMLLFMNFKYSPFNCNKRMYT